MERGLGAGEGVLPAPLPNTGVGRLGAGKQACVKTVDGEAKANIAFWQLLSGGGMDIRGGVN